jgi:hypothetical protein
VALLDELHQHVTHSLEVGDLGFDVAHFGFRLRPDFGSCGLGVQPQAEQPLDLLEREAEVLGSPDEPQDGHSLLVVLSVAGGSALRFFEQSLALVEPHGFNAHTRLPGNFADGQGLHRTSSYPEYRPRTILQSQGVTTFFGNGRRSGSFTSRLEIEQFPPKLSLDFSRYLHIQ